MFSCFLLFSFSAFADSVHQAEHNGYFKCKHTQQKIERTKNCPCGCNKKKHAALRITADHENCDGDDVVAHLPQFAKLAAHTTGTIHAAPQTMTTSYFSETFFPETLFVRPPVPPG